MQSLFVTLQRHHPTLAGAGYEPTLPPLAHPLADVAGQADGNPQNFWYESAPKSALSPYRVGAVLLDEKALMRYFWVQSDSAVDFEVVLCRLGSDEQLLQPVKIPAEEPELRCRRVSPLCQDVEDRVIYDA